jgi:hypothetical protein
MPRAVGRLLLAAFLTSVLISRAGFAGERPRKGEADAKDRLTLLVVGKTTAAEVREILGPPQRVAREILYARYVEQWTYDAPPVRIVFDWRKGQEKRIQTVQPLTNPAR